MAPASARLIPKRLSAIALLFSIVSAAGPSAGPERTPAFRAFPLVTLWAWESPEDLHEVDPQRFGVAYLDETIFISREVSSRPRRQPLLVPSGARLMAVVRLEAARSADLYAPGLTQTVATLIMHSVQKPGVTALQIDFDAARSQREFYAALISGVRRLLPEGMPISITALASWCAADDWIRTLSVDEAVPMFFRMGRDVRPSDEAGWSYPLREPLCMNSVGVSMDEPWPAIRSGQRVYVFHPRAWNPVALHNLDEMLKR